MPIDAALLTVILTVVLNFLVWWLQRVVNRKTILIERRKLESEIKREEISAISSVTEKYNELTQRYVETSSTLMELKIHFESKCADIDSIRDKIEELSNENSTLKIKNEKIQQDVETLKLENIRLRFESENLRKGINILIQQLKDSGISPVWQPSN